MELLHSVRDHFFIWPDVVVQTPPPTAIVGRSLLSLRHVDFQQFLVISTPAPNSGNYRLDVVVASERTGFSWGASLDDIAAPAAAPIWPDPWRNDGNLQLLRTSLNQLRAYWVDQFGTGARFLGTAQRPNDGAVMGVTGYGTWFTVLTATGETPSYNVTFTGGSPGLTGPNGQGIFQGANARIISIASPLIGILFATSDGALHWTTGGVTYPQLNDPTLAPFLGTHNYSFAWYVGQDKWATLLVTETGPVGFSGFSAFKVYYHPGIGDTRSWRLLRFAGAEASTPTNFYTFPDAGGVQWDAWAPIAVDAEFVFPESPPIHIVTSGGGKVRRLRLVPDLASLTFSVTNSYSRDRIASVAWFKGTSAPMWHVELQSDGTLRLVRPSFRFLPSLFR